MNTWHIHIEGLVQGVGFRPFVYKAALDQKLVGWVINGVDGVHIRFNADRKKANRFYNGILKSAPRLSRIMNHSLDEAASEVFENFEIRESNVTGTPNLLITPDFALCKDCEEELFNKGDRRFHYPFITCTNCGPRYSIVQTLPYDRPRTTMDPFQMCQLCEEEYNNALERRHFSQTNSCDECGVNLLLEDSSGNIEKDEPDLLVSKVGQHILAGKIIGVKGIGGYLLMADAENEDAVQLLRERKDRPTKPFALMYPDIESIRQDVYLTEAEEKLIMSVESPIVLLKLREKSKTKIAVNNIAPGLNEIGVMRPYAPLFALLMKTIRKPLIATSGNVSGSPVIYSDEMARSQLFNICDFILTNDREIVVPQDDSVEKLLPDERKLVFRRSRGYAPNFVHNHFAKSVPDMLAMGAMLKSTFALTNNGNTYVSQYLGDLESFDTQESYNKTLQHFFKLFKPKPNEILVDLHPNYYSTQKGKEIARAMGVPVIEVQHHEAHLMAVLAENHLLEKKDKVLGVIWDGTGLGRDMQIWGGEYFIYDNNQIERVGHLPYFKHILGDKFSREPRLAALSLCHSHCLNSDSLESRFTSEEWELYSKILNKENNLLTSSMGRLFDGVSSFLEITNHNTFEGEAAMHLQTKAERFARKNGLINNTFLSLDGGLGQCLNEIMIGVNAGINKGKIAYDFHNWLVNQVRIQAIENNVEKVVFSGGVLQNSLLLYLLKQRLGSDFELYFHKQLSPNDECISFGQLVSAYVGVQWKSEDNQQRPRQARKVESI